MTIAATPLPTPAEEDAKDAPLRDDIRLLGRILGDTVREQEGEETYKFVENIRQASIRFHRDNETGARRELTTILDGLDHDQTFAILRAYSYFSHLANIAEDEHHTRRNRAHIVKGSAARPGSMHLRLSARQRGGRRAGDAAQVLRRRARQPGARPPIRRKCAARARSPTNCRSPIWSPSAAASPATKRRWPKTRNGCARTVLLLWRTNLLRQNRLRVIDEVANGLSYYDYTFFDQIPRIHAAVEDELARQAPKTAKSRVSTFLRVGSWIGGDRDGNPFVTAERAQRGDPLAERARLAALSRRSARTRRRTVNQRRADARQPGTDGARRALRRQIRRAQGRALSPRDQRHVRTLAKTAAQLDQVTRAAAADRRRGHALPERRRIRGGSRGDHPTRWKPMAARSSHAAACGR